MSVTMPLKLYNTLSREREIFTPLDASNVRLYVCGPTVYDFAHIGNARPLIVFDVLYRLLREKYGAAHVKYVRNITDVDDKINARAAERGVTIRELTEETNRIFQEDARGAGLPAARRPAARDRTYRRDDRDHRKADRQRPRLCGRRPCAVRRALHARLRPVVAPPARRHDRRRPRRSRALQEGRDGFRAVEAVARTTSPAGTAPGVAAVRAGISNARPCRKSISAKSSTFTAAASTSSSRITRTKSPRPAAPSAMTSWPMSGCTTVSCRSKARKCRKASAISSPFTTCCTSEKFGGKAWKGEVLRLAMMRSHYRQPIDWTVKALEEAEKTLSRWYGILRAQGVSAESAAEAPVAPEFCRGAARRSQHSARHGGIARNRRQGRAVQNPDRPRRGGKTCARGGTAGPVAGRPGDLGRARADGADVDAAAVEKLVTERLAARKARNFAESDRLRDVLTGMGVKLKDGKDPATGELVTDWEVAREVSMLESRAPPFSPCGRRWREAPDEGLASTVAEPSSVSPSASHLLPQGEKGARSCHDAIPPDDPEKDWRASLPFPAHWLWLYRDQADGAGVGHVWFALHYYGLI